MPDEKDKSERARQIENDVKEADAKRRRDAERDTDTDAGEKLDKILAACDALCTRMDEMDNR